jgi:hypothetical protein
MIEIDTRTMDARLRAFAHAFARYATRNPPLVQLVAELAPHTVAFWREHPDRLMCGRVAFDELRAKGFDEAPTC